MKLSTFVAVLSWFSVFMLIWSILWGRLPSDVDSNSALIFFCVLALFASIFHSAGRNPR